VATDAKTTQLERMDVELKEALREIAQKGVEMERIKAVIERDRRKLLSSAETSVTDVLTDAIVAGTFSLAVHSCVIAEPQLP
jgi:hypothetical protein